MVPRAVCSWSGTGRRCRRSTRTSTRWTFGDRSRVVAGDAVSAAATIDADIVFADPPYDFDAWPELLARVTGDFVVAESGAEIEAPDGWVIIRSKRYGRTRVTFLERDVAPELGSDSQ